MNNLKIVTAGIVIREGKVLVAKRTRQSHRGYLWEFPGGKMESDEDPKACLKRELAEELDIGVTVGEILEVVYHRDTRDILFCSLVTGANWRRELRKPWDVKSIGGWEGRNSEAFPCRKPISRYARNS